MSNANGKKEKITAMVKTDHLKYEYAAYGSGGNSGLSEVSDSITALEEISVTINKGEFVAVLGHNGSGKSTLARHMNALLKPTNGTVWIKGMDTKNDDNIWNIRQAAGMVFQNPDNQIIATIVEEDVAFGPENLGIPPKDIRKRVDDALATVGMSNYWDRSPHFLSGGQKQRIAIAGVLAMKPDCIILDEPTAMLDPSGRKEVIDSVTRLNREEGITIILITHYMEEAVKADRVIVMDHGKIVMDSVPKDVFSKVEEMQALGLDVPQTTECAYLLNKQGIRLPNGILAIDEMVNAICRYGANKNRAAFVLPGISTSSKTEYCFEINDLTHIYSPETAFQKKALDNISLNIIKGSFVGLIGHTGSGKSTLIQHLNAIIKPTSGKILLYGNDINEDKEKLKSIRQKVGLVFQYPEHQLFEMTVAKDVAFGPENMHLDSAEVEKRVRESLELVGIPTEYFDKSPFELSGGQKRRVAIAGVLAMKPDVLILDEPTAGLDPKGRDDILHNIKIMHEKLGITVILVSHSMEDVAKYADTVIVMHNARISMQGSCAEVFSNCSELEKMGLAAPKISYVISALKEKGYNLPNGIYTVENAAEALAHIMK